MSKPGCDACGTVASNPLLHAVTKDNFFNVEQGSLDCSDLSASTRYRRLHTGHHSSKVHEFLSRRFDGVTCRLRLTIQLAELVVEGFHLRKRRPSQRTFAQLINLETHGAGETSLLSRLSYNQLGTVSTGYDHKARGRVTTPVLTRLDRTEIRTPQIPCDTV